MSRSSTGDTIVAEVTINAPADRIFTALTSPVERVKWWGAEGRFKTTQMESDLRPGGAWIMRGIGVGGRPFTIQGIYREIQPCSLEFTWMPSWQTDAAESLVRFDLQEEHGRTTVRVTHSCLANDSARAQHRGWPDILDWLRAYIEARN